MLSDVPQGYKSCTLAAGWLWKTTGHERASVWGGSVAFLKLVSSLKGVSFSSITRRRAGSCVIVLI